MLRLKPALTVLTLLALSPSAAFATEAAMGRYIPGVFVTPVAGVLPPAGFYWNSSSIYYSGDAGTGLEIPVAGTIQFGLDAEIIGTTFTGLWVPQLNIAEDTTFALSVSVPVQNVKVTASFGPFEEEQSQTALGDIMIAPTIGWHSGKNFLSGSLRIFTPTGAYDVGALDNVGMNYWTFSPTVSYTYLDMERGLDFSLVGGVDINTKNNDTDYTSGAMAHLDVSLMQYFNERFAVGVFGSVLYQFQADEGGLADDLGGFKGRSFAIGPVVKYMAGPKENPINVSLSWAPEFETRNRLKGNGVYLNISGKF